MPRSTPHQKFCFYHLPTRGRAGIKLGDAWYVSNVSIIFYWSMLYYLLFWTLLGFIIHFYIIFGTNLLTGCPAQICCFLPISVFRRKGISNGVQTEWNLRERDFLTERDPGDLDPTSRNKRDIFIGMRKISKILICLYNVNPNQIKLYYKIDMLWNSWNSI